MYDSPYLPFTTPTIFAKRAVLKAESAANSNHASIKIVITDEDIKSQIEEIKLKLVDETRNKKISEFKAQTKAELKQLYAEIKELEKFEPHYIFEHDKRFEQYQDEIIDSRMKEIEYERLEENYREAAEEYALRDRIYEETVAEKWGEERLDLYYVDKFIRFDKSLENNMRIDDLTLLDMTSSRIRDKAKENGEYYSSCKIRTVRG